MLKRLIKGDTINGKKENETECVFLYTIQPLHHSVSAAVAGRSLWLPIVSVTRSFTVPPPFLLPFGPPLLPHSLSKDSIREASLLSEYNETGHLSQKLVFTQMWKQAGKYRLKKESLLTSPSRAEQVNACRKSAREGPQKGWHRSL